MNTLKEMVRVPCSLHVSSRRKRSIRGIELFEQGKLNVTRPWLKV